MTPEDFEYLRQLLRERSGLVLSAEKQYLAESRLLPVARKHGVGTLAELVGKLKTHPVPLIVEVVEAMTTNETFFFRDKLPFEHFRDTIMPALMAARARDKRIRIWCTAAISAGMMVSRKCSKGSLSRKKKVSLVVIASTTSTISGIGCVLSLPTSSASVPTPCLRATGSRRLSARYCFSADSTRPERSRSS